MVVNKSSYWYCPYCREEIGPANVTFQELHDTCGHAVEWIEGIDIDRLREICAAEKNGTLHIAPCKIGDKVTARVNRPYTGHDATIHGEVSDIQLVFRVRHESVRHVDFMATDFGKTVFLTRPEAEAALIDRNRIDDVEYFNLPIVNAEAALKGASNAE